MMTPMTTPAPAPAPKAPAVGDILSCGWGYEQTRYDFYQVVAVTAKSVKIVKIAKTYIDHGPAPGYATVMPVPGNFVGDKPMTKRVGATWNGTGYSVKIASYASASLWSGKPEQESGDY